ncbi:MAG: hypothetical protein ACHQEM_07835, partial [Chitinophagales bacterium]
MEYDNDRLIRPSYKIELFYWGILVIFNPLFNSLTWFPRDIKIWAVIFMVSLVVLPAYIIYGRILAPKFLFGRRPFLFVLISVAFFILVQLILWGIFSLINEHITERAAAYFTYSASTIIREVLWSVFNMLLAIAIAFIKKALDEKDRILELQEDNIHFKL